MQTSALPLGYVALIGAGNEARTRDHNTNPKTNIKNNFFINVLSLKKISKQISFNYLILLRLLFYECLL
ncbi:MAG: hypothetical protein IJ967_01520, partial [Phascolarctobacterium sp.]|nr:hypothetical protein [Phascolarctobacterium sp.]